MKEGGRTERNPPQKNLLAQDINDFFKLKTKTPPMCAICFGGRFPIIDIVIMTQEREIHG